LALFNKSEGKEKTKNIVKFDPIKLDTENVVKELKSISTSKKIPTNELDFNLLGSKTMYKAGAEDEQWIEVNEQNKKFFCDDMDFLLNPDLKIRQFYKIEIFKKKNDDEIVNPVIVMGANKKLTKIVATVKMNLDIPYTDTLGKNILTQINKKKLLSGLLINIFEGNLKKEIKKVLAKVKADGALMEDYKIIAGVGIEPVMPIHAQVIEHYKDSVQQDEDGKIDHSKKGFVLAVKKDDNVIEYIKPKEGVSGRDCKGRFLAVKEARVIENVDFKTTDNVQKEELEDRVILVAKKDGYVKEENGVYDIDDNLEINELSLKDTGSIEAGIDTNVSINITEEDELKDAVGSGIKVEVAEINVNGNVGDNSSVIAKDMFIGGQTHQSSHLEATTAKINIHKGYLKADTAEIKSLESGTVDAKIAKVKRSIGGNVRAQEIYIENAKSNLRATAIDLIEIESITGTDNEFVIDQSSVTGYEDKITDLREQIKTIREDEKQLPKKIELKRKVINQNKESIEMIKERKKELESSGHSLPGPLLSKLQSYQNRVFEYQTLVTMQKEYQDRIVFLKEELKKFQDAVFEAKIRNKTSWTEGNKIIFNLIDPAIKVEYTTKENELVKEFSLREDEDGKFYIHKSVEFSG
jgi:hypothetical protein